jgi:hypothetical protein
LLSATTIPFNVSSDARSAAADRFRIVFNASAALPVNFTSVKAVQKNQQVDVEWTVATEANISSYDIEKSVNGRDFSKAANVNARGSNSAATYNWIDINAAEGNNFYRIRSISQNGERKYTSIVNVKIGKANGGIVAYPNPIKERTLSLQFNNQPQGTYTLRMFNNIGQQVFSKAVKHLGGSSSQTVQLSSSIARGIYQLQVTNGETTTNQKVICD